MANTNGEKELKRSWPVISGLIARTTKQEGRTSNLVARKNLVPERDEIGL